MQKILDDVTDVQSSAGANLRRLATRQSVPIGLSLLLLYVLWDHATDLDFSTIWAGIGQVKLVEWAIAAGLTAASLWAVGRYDAVVHRLTGTGISNRAATRAGVTAIAVAQSVGFGVISGALVRWRMLPELSLLQSIRVSASVAISFLAGWAVVAALAVLLSPTTLPFPATPFVAFGILALAIVLALLSVYRPGPLARLHLPSLKAMGTIFALVLLDTLTAGGALYALLPESIHIGLPTFLAAFLVALGAGLVMGTPGGLGPFEAMLITLLPHIEISSLLSAVLAFRVVYYAIPALISAVFVIRGPNTNASSKPHVDYLHSPSSDAEHGFKSILNSTPDAEAALLLQGQLSLYNTGTNAAMVRASSQTLVMLKGWLNGETSPASLTALSQQSQSRFLTPCLYKAPARLAAHARALGWQVLPISKEAVINPQTYTQQGRAFRQLRRKLRKATEAGISITARHPGQALPLAEMAKISAKWVQMRGGERGFSMGVFDPKTICEAQVFLAWQDAQLIGFLTLHSNSHEQVLDLMRYGPDTPDGLMHLLLDRAINDAKAQGLRKLSLASVPCGEHAGEIAALQHLRNHFDKITGANGLRQFKTCFAPKWRMQYMAAPTKMALVLAAIDISREITRDTP